MIQNTTRSEDSHQMELSARPADLPDFKRPPVTEVVLSVQFATIPEFRSVHIGLLWERLREKYPNVTEHPPLNASFETFGLTATQTPPPIQFEMFLTHYHDFEPDRRWQAEVLKPLAKYATLPRGWDSYAGHPLRWDAGFFALWILNAVMRPRTPIPRVVPSPVGGVQLEWHEKDIDLELHITAPYEWELWFEDHRTGERISTELSNDLSDLVRPISELTSR
jgi:hypothetical protein